MAASCRTCAGGVDPDEFEVMWLLPRASWSEFENAPPIERLQLEVDLARWSVSPPPPN